MPKRNQKNGSCWNCRYTEYECHLVGNPHRFSFQELVDDRQLDLRPFENSKIAKPSKRQKPVTRYDTITSTRRLAGSLIHGTEDGTKKQEGNEKKTLKNQKLFTNNSRVSFVSPRLI